VTKKMCPYNWLSADKKHTHTCKYLEGHTHKHECLCGALPRNGNT
jgi:hypothetical protein